MNSKNLSSKLEWNWIITGAVVGTLLTFLNIWLMAAHVGSFDNPQGLFSLFSLMLSGIFIAYKSRGNTVFEPAIGGSLAIIITLLLLNLFSNVNFLAIQILLAQALAFQLSMIGGWVGEQLQSGVRAKGEGKTFVFQWAWSVAAAALAFILSLTLYYASIAGLKATNGLSVFALQMSFLISSGIGFFSAGYFIGFRSPGKTIIETGVGGLLGFCLVIGFWLVDRGGMDSFALEAWDYYSLGFSFAMALIGGWVGEWSEKSLTKQRNEN